MGPSCHGLRDQLHSALDGHGTTHWRPPSSQRSRLSQDATSMKLASCSKWFPFGQTSLQRTGNGGVPKVKCVLYNGGPGLARRYSRVCVFNCYNRLRASAGCSSSTARATSSSHATWTGPAAAACRSSSPRTSSSSSCTKTR